MTHYNKRRRLNNGQAKKFSQDSSDISDFKSESDASRSDYFSCNSLQRNIILKDVNLNNLNDIIADAPEAMEVDNKPKTKLRNFILFFYYIETIVLLFIVINLNLSMKICKQQN